ncbi:UNKNOWN [Stylonychia lemnae]|uniref:Uncharacterized protein n=1 Tax=Stylonychia lemnae TaxID=5949 RepID=A0A078A7N3_STYLE|nr:UNKNOWN [Stylonychia lemnae]|eukprot:CDW77577.1 UNKNOWN [Stylonychia lemnae]
MEDQLDSNNSNIFSKQSQNNFPQDQFELNGFLQPNIEIQNEDESDESYIEVLDQGIQIRCSLNEPYPDERVYARIQEKVEIFKNQIINANWFFGQECRVIEYNHEVHLLDLNASTLHRQNNLIFLAFENSISFLQQIVKKEQYVLKDVYKTQSSV